MNRLYDIKIPIIGITGGIASGKSSFSNFISSNDEQVICADKIIKKIYALPETVEFIKRLHPNVVKSSNNIDFKKLRSLVFSDESLKNTLENYLHPKIKNVFINEITPKRKRIFYDVPLLFEKNMQSHFDYIILITTTKGEQQKRIFQRDKSPPELITKILESQMEQKEKETKSNYIVKNDRDLESLKEEAKKVLDLVKLRFP